MNLITRVANILWMRHKKLLCSVLIVVLVAAGAGGFWKFADKSTKATLVETGLNASPDFVRHNLPVTSLSTPDYAAYAKCDDLAQRELAVNCDFWYVGRDAEQIDNTTVFIYHFQADVPIPEQGTMHVDGVYIMQIGRDGTLVADRLLWVSSAQL